jgi:hypothetical protein
MVRPHHHLPGAKYRRDVCNITSHLGDMKCVLLRQRVRGPVRVVRADRNTWAFQTETSVVADGAL